MSLTPGALTYTLDSSEKDSAGYIGPIHAFNQKDDIILKRVAPKPTAVFSGVSRTSWKWTYTNVLSGALTPRGDSIFELNVSMPIGVAAATADALAVIFQSMIAEADFVTHVKNARIQF